MSFATSVGFAAASRLEDGRLATWGDVMKNAAVVLALLLFCTAPVQDAWAKSNLGLNRLGVDVGMVDPEAVGGTLGLGASADWGTLSERVHLSSHLGYWSKSEDYGFGSEASIRDVSFTTRVTYHFRVSSPKFQR